MYQGEVHLDVKIDNPSTVKSARIDDEKLHKIEIEFLSGEASLIVDETNYGAIYFYGDQRPSGQVLMGKSDISSKYQQGFYGCIESFSVQNKDLDFKRGTESGNLPNMKCEELKARPPYVRPTQPTVPTTTTVMTTTEKPVVVSCDAANGKFNGKILLDFKHFSVE